MKGHSC